ncbi:proteinase B ASCRUDRAFT_16692, partial [Ascoidea rubescens DSM 1968]
NSFAGYAGYFPDYMINLLRKNPQVAFIEKDSKVFANEFDIQNGSPWGLARISHRERLTLGTFNKYLYDNEGGEGVTAYVIDTGVSVTHKQFEGRAQWGKTIPLNDADIDGNGHGTHCAGTIGSKDYGVAKKAKIVAVKVLKSNGSGTMSDVIKGVEFAANSHIADSKAGKKGFKGSTANMSLGGGKSPALDLAVNASVKAGLHFAVAAGNENQDACNTSPAAAENAITVGASTLGDTRAYFSNYGKCVDIFAPGLNVLSTYIGSDESTATLSGTSMASPHICGLLTYFLSLYPDSDSGFSAASSITPAQLKKNLISYGTDGILSDIPDAETPNVLAFNGAGGNLTQFWSTGSSSKVSNSDFKITQEFETKLDSFVQNLENKLEGKAKEIEQLINDL